MPANLRLANLLAGAWNNLGAPLRRGLARMFHAKFIHGVSGIVLDGQGRILLLKHRFWKDQCWGLPSGMACPGETLAETLARELVEETGMTVLPRKLLSLSTRQRNHTVFYLLADSAGQPRVASVEIIEARFYDPAELPENLLGSHRQLIHQFFSKGGLPGIDLE